MPEVFIKRLPEDHPSSYDDPPKEGTFKQDPDEEKTLLWTAPARPYHKKDRSYYTTIAIIVTLLILIALLAQEFLLIGVLLALTFVTYVLAFVPPEDVEYRLSTNGVGAGGHFYVWDDLDSFWFSEKEGHRILHILTKLKFPRRLLFILGPHDEDTVKKILAKYISFREIAPRSLLDGWAESIQKHFPLENPHR